MISLLQLLKESLNKPKAIFLAGPAGSGKSYISKQLIPSSFIIINSDDTYEEMLKKSGIGLKQKDFNPDQLSQAAKFQAQAVKDTNQKFLTLSQEKKNIVIDGTGAASNPVLKKKQQLEDLGYDVFMLMIYVSPLVSLERNKNRDRSLNPSIVLRTWRDVNKNIETYKESFSNNFSLINNNPEDTNISFSKEILQPYLSTTHSGRPKTPEELEKSKIDFDNLVSDVVSLSKTLPKTETISQVKNKINNFINE